MARTKNVALERERREMLSRVVVGLLAEESHQRLTLDRVARRASVSKGMLTYWFRSKDELLLAAIEHHLEQQLALFELILADDSLPAAERLARMVAVALPPREVTERATHFLLEVFSYAKERPEAADLLREAYLRFRRACEALLDHAAAEGYVTVSDREAAHLALHALLDGMALQLVIDPKIDLEALRPRLIAMVERLLR